MATRYAVKENSAVRELFGLIAAVTMAACGGIFFGLQVGSPGQGLGMLGALTLLFSLLLPFVNDEIGFSLWTKRWQRILFVVGFIVSAILAGVTVTPLIQAQLHAYWLLGTTLGSAILFMWAARFGS